MDQATPMFDASAVTGEEATRAKRQRRSKIERLQQQQERLEQRLAATRRREQQLALQLKQAAAQAKQLAQKADARDMMLVGAAFLGLLARGDYAAYGMQAALIKFTEQPNRRRMWNAFKRYTSQASEQN